MAVFITPFTTPSNYTYDSNKIEVSDGLAKLKFAENVYARWHLNESSGNNVSDDSGNGRDGTRVNTPSWVVGKLNNCLQFDGVNQYVNCGNIVNFERTNAFSLECWFKTSIDTKTLMSKTMDSPSYRGIHLHIAGGNIYFALFNDLATLNYLQVYGNSIVINGAWRHLIVTYDGSNNAAGVRIYIDNVEETVTLVKDTLSGTILNSEDFLLGQRFGTEFFNGYMDEAVIYNKDLNPEEVDYRFNSTVGRENWYLLQLDDDYINLKGYWEFEDNYVDSSGWGNAVNNFGAIFVDGKVDRCLSFNGINNYLEANGVADNAFFSNGHTIMAWGKLSNWSGNQTIFCGGRIAGVGYCEIDFSGTTDKRIYARVRDTVGNSNVVASLNVYNLDSDWHHFALVVDSSGHIVAFYIDGVDQGGDSTYNLNLLNFDKFYIGQLVYSSPVNFWTGLIDEVAVYKRLVTEVKVQDIYNAGVGRHLNRFVSDAPTIYKTAGDSGTINAFNSFLVTEGVVEGSLRYQLSSDGVIWYYWDGGAWSVAGSFDYNIEVTVNTNINSFPTGSDKIYVKTFFISDGMQRVEIDEFQITYTFNEAPLIDAGSNKLAKDGQTIKPFSDCTFSDPDGTIDVVRYKVDGEVDVWTDISKGGYSSLLEAVQDFDYTFNNTGIITVRLQVEDNVGATSDDSLTVTVTQYTRTVNIRNSITESHIAVVDFNPGDGSGSTLQNSPFTYSWDYGTVTLIMESEGYYSKAQNVLIDSETELDLIMIPISYLNECKASVGWVVTTDTLVITTWLLMNGGVITVPTNCTINFKDKDGVVLYNASSSSSGVDGVFKFEKSPSGLLDEGVYRLESIIIANAITYTTIISLNLIDRRVADFITDTHDEALGKWVLNPDAKTLTLYRLDNTILKVMDLTDTTQTLASFIGRTPR